MPLETNGLTRLASIDKASEPMRDANGRIMDPAVANAFRAVQKFNATMKGTGSYGSFRVKQGVPTYMPKDGRYAVAAKKYNVNLNPLREEKWEGDFRNMQSGLEAIGNTITGFGKQFAGGFVSSVGSIGDGIEMAIDYVSGNVDKDGYGNFITKFGEDMIKNSQDNDAIYMTDEDDSIFSPRYWGMQAQNLGLSVGIIVEAMAEEAALSAAAAAMGLTGVGAAGSVATAGVMAARAAQTASRIGRLMSIGGRIGGRAAGFLAKAGVFGAIQGFKETAMNARETQNSVYEAMISHGMDESTALEIASTSARDAAAREFIPTMAMSALQYGLMGGMLKKAGLNRIDPFSVAGSRAAKTSFNYGASNIIETLLDKVTPNISNKWIRRGAGLATQALAEDVEEGWQTSNTKYFVNRALREHGFLNPMDDNINDLYWDKEMKDSMIGGAFGGALFYGFGKLGQRGFRFLQRDKIQAREQAQKDFINGIAERNAKLMESVDNLFGENSPLTTDEQRKMAKSRLMREFNHQSVMEAMRHDYINQSTSGFDAYMGVLNNLEKHIKSGDKEAMAKYGFSDNITLEEIQALRKQAMDAREAFVTEYNKTDDDFDIAALQVDRKKRIGDNNEIISEYDKAIEELDTKYDTANLNEHEKELLKLSHEARKAERNANLKFQNNVRTDEEFNNRFDAVVNEENEKRAKAGEALLSDKEKIEIENNIFNEMRDKDPSFGIDEQAQQEYNEAFKKLNEYHEQHKDNINMDKVSGLNNDNYLDIKEEVEEYKAGIDKLQTEYDNFSSKKYQKQYREEQNKKVLDAIEEATKKINEDETLSKKEKRDRIRALTGKKASFLDKIKDWYETKEERKNPATAAAQDVAQSENAKQDKAPNQDQAPNQAQQSGSPKTNANEDNEAYKEIERMKQQEEDRKRAKEAAKTYTESQKRLIENKTELSISEMVEALKLEAGFPDGVSNEEFIDGVLKDALVKIKDIFGSNIFQFLDANIPVSTNKEGQLYVDPSRVTVSVSTVTENIDGNPVDALLTREELDQRLGIGEKYIDGISDGGTLETTVLYSYTNGFSPNLKSSRILDIKRMLAEAYGETKKAEELKNEPKKPVADAKIDVKSTMYKNFITSNKLLVNKLRRYLSTVYDNNDSIDATIDNILSQLFEVNRVNVSNGVVAMNFEFHEAHQDQVGGQDKLGFYIAIKPHNGSTPTGATKVAMDNGHSIIMVVDENGIPEFALYDITNESYVGPSTVIPTYKGNTNNDIASFFAPERHPLSAEDKPKADALNNKAATDAYVLIDQYRGENDTAAQALLNAVRQSPIVALGLSRGGKLEHLIAAYNRFAKQNGLEDIITDEDIVAIGNELKTNIAVRTDTALTTLFGQEMSPMEVLNTAAAEASLINAYSEDSYTPSQSRARQRSSRNTSNRYVNRVTKSENEFTPVFPLFDGGNDMVLKDSGKRLLDGHTYKIGDLFSVKPVDLSPESIENMLGLTESDREFLRNTISDKQIFDTDNGGKVWSQMSDEEKILFGPVAIFDNQNRFVGYVNRPGFNTKDAKTQQVSLDIRNRLLKGENVTIRLTRKNGRFDTRKGFNINELKDTERLRGKEGLESIGSIWDRLDRDAFPDGKTRTAASDDLKVMFLATDEDGKRILVSPTGTIEVNDKLKAVGDFRTATDGDVYVVARDTNGLPYAVRMLKELVSNEDANTLATIVSDHLFRGKNADKKNLLKIFRFYLKPRNFDSEEKALEDYINTKDAEDNGYDVRTPLISIRKNISIIQDAGNGMHRIINLSTGKATLFDEKGTSIVTEDFGYKDFTHKPNKDSESPMDIFKEAVRQSRYFINIELLKDRSSEARMPRIVARENNNGKIYHYPEYGSSESETYEQALGRRLYTNVKIRNAGIGSIVPTISSVDYGQYTFEHMTEENSVLNPQRPMQSQSATQKSSSKVDIVAPQTIQGNTENNGKEEKKEDNENKQEEKKPEQEGKKDDAEQDKYDELEEDLENAKPILKSTGKKDSNGNEIFSYGNPKHSVDEEAARIALNDGISNFSFSHKTKSATAGQITRLQNEIDSGELSTEKARAVLLQIERFKAEIAIRELLGKTYDPLYRMMNESDFDKYDRSELLSHLSTLEKSTDVFELADALNSVNRISESGIPMTEQERDKYNIALYKLRAMGYDVFLHGDELFSNPISEEYDDQGKLVGGYSVYNVETPSIFKGFSLIQEAEVTIKPLVESTEEDEHEEEEEQEDGDNIEPKKKRKKEQQKQGNFPKNPTEMPSETEKLVDDIKAKHAAMGGSVAGATNREIADAHLAQIEKDGLTPMQRAILAEYIYNYLTSSDNKTNLVGNIAKSLSARMQNIKNTLSEQRVSLMAANDISDEDKTALLEIIDSHLNLINTIENTTSEVKASTDSNGKSINRAKKDAIKVANQTNPVRSALNRANKLISAATGGRVKATESSITESEFELTFNLNEELDEPTKLQLTRAVRALFTGIERPEESFMGLPVFYDKDAVYRKLEFVFAFPSDVPSNFNEMVQRVKNSSEIHPEMKIVADRMEAMDERTKAQFMSAMVKNYNNYKKLDDTGRFIIANDRDIFVSTPERIRASIMEAIFISDDNGNFTEESIENAKALVEAINTLSEYVFKRNDITTDDINNQLRIINDITGIFSDAMIRMLSNGNGIPYFSMDNMRPAIMNIKTLFNEKNGILHGLLNIASPISTIKDLENSSDDYESLKSDVAIMPSVYNFSNATVEVEADKFVSSFMEGDKLVSNMSNPRMANDITSMLTMDPEHMERLSNSILSKDLTITKLLQYAYDDSKLFNGGGKLALLRRAITFAPVSISVSSDFDNRMTEADSKTYDMIAREIYKANNALMPNSSFNSIIEEVYGSHFAIKFKFANMMFPAMSDKSQSYTMSFPVIDFEGTKHGDKATDEDIYRFFFKETVMPEVRRIADYLKNPSKYRTDGNSIAFQMIHILPDLNATMIDTGNGTSLPLLTALQTAIDNNATTEEAVLLVAQTLEDRTLQLLNGTEEYELNNMLFNSYVYNTMIGDFAFFGLDKHFKSAKIKVDNRGWAIVDDSNLNSFMDSVSKSITGDLYTNTSKRLAMLTASGQKLMNSSGDSYIQVFLKDASMPHQAFGYLIGLHYGKDSENDPVTVKLLKDLYAEDEVFEQQGASTTVTRVDTVLPSGWESSVVEYNDHKISAARAIAYAEALALGDKHTADEILNGEISDKDLGGTISDLKKNKKETVSSQEYKNKVKESIQKIVSQVIENNESIKSKFDKAKGTTFVRKGLSTKISDGKVTVKGDNTLGEVLTELGMSGVESQKVSLRDQAIEKLSEMYPKIADFLKNPSTDAQEYTTAKEAIDVIFRRGRMSDGQYKTLSEKIKMQQDAANKGLPLPKESLLTPDEIGLVMQPTKPVYAHPVWDSTNNIFVPKYIKSSSIALLPQITEGLEIDKLRLEMERIERETGKNVRASYQSANKVGGLDKKANIWKANGDFSGLTIDESMYKELPRDGFKIQQDNPQKHTGSISIMTQIQKVLFADGVADIENGFIIKMLGEDRSRNVSGRVLYEHYADTLRALVAIKKEQLFMDLGMTHDGKIENREKFVKSIEKIIIEEADDNQYPESEIEIIKKALTTDGNGNTLFDIALLPNSVKYENLIISTLNKRLFALKIPGYSYVTGSEAGFRRGTMIREDSEDAGKLLSRVVYTSEWEGKLMPSRMETRSIIRPSLSKDGKPIAYNEKTASKYGKTIFVYGESLANNTSLNEDGTFKEETRHGRQIVRSDKNGKPHKNARGLVLYKSQSDKGVTFFNDTDEDLEVFREANSSVIESIANDLSDREYKDIMFPDTLAYVVTNKQVKILNSLFEEHIPGVKVSIVEVDGKKKLKIDTSKVKEVEKFAPAQILVPSKFVDNDGNAIEFIHSDGTVNEKYVRRVGDHYELIPGMIKSELFDRPSARIPTSSLVSSSPTRVVGFLPPEAGDTIIVPTNFTTQKGMDYDVDKENTYSLYTKILADGRIVPYSPDNITQVWSQLLGNVNANERKISRSSSYSNDKVYGDWLEKASILTEADRHYYGVAESGSSMTMTAHSGNSTGVMIAPIEEGEKDDDEETSIEKRADDAAKLNGNGRENFKSDYIHAEEKNELALSFRQANGRSLASLKKNQRARALAYHKVATKADSLYIMERVSGGSVSGMSRYAFNEAKRLGKPIFAYDYTTDMAYVYSYNTAKFEHIGDIGILQDIPVGQNPAVVGTRQSQTTLEGNNFIDNGSENSIMDNYRDSSGSLEYDQPLKGDIGFRNIYIASKKLLVKEEKGKKSRAYSGSIAKILEASQSQEQASVIDGMFDGDRKKDRAKKLESLEKIVKNEFVRITSAVLNNGDARVQEKINRVLSMDKAREQAKLLGPKGNRMTGVNSYGNPSYQANNAYLGHVGKVGIGVYSNYVVQLGLMQTKASVESNRLGGKHGVRIAARNLENTNTTSEAIGPNYSSVSFSIGNSKYELNEDGSVRKSTKNKSEVNISSRQNIDGIIDLGVNTKTLDGGRTIAEALAERQNTATDNGKEQIMGRLNVNEHTVGIDASLIIMGLDNAMVGDREVNIPYAISSSHIMRGYSMFKAMSMTSNMNTDYASITSAVRYIGVKEGSGNFASDTLKRVMKNIHIRYNSDSNQDRITKDSEFAKYLAQYFMSTEYMNRVNDIMLSRITELREDGLSDVIDNITDRIKDEFAEVDLALLLNSKSEEASILLLRLNNIVEDESKGVGSSQKKLISDFFNDRIMSSNLISYAIIQQNADTDAYIDMNLLDYIKEHPSGLASLVSSIHLYEDMYKSLSPEFNADVDLDLGLLIASDEDHVLGFEGSFDEKMRNEIQAMLLAKQAKNISNELLNGASLSNIQKNRLGHSISEADAQFDKYFNGLDDTYLNGYTDFVREYGFADTFLGAAYPAYKQVRGLFRRDASIVDNLADQIMHSTTGASNTTQDEYEFYRKLARQRILSRAIQRGMNYPMYALDTTIGGKLSFLKKLEVELGKAKRSMPHIANNVFVNKLKFKTEAGVSSFSLGHNTGDQVDRMRAVMDFELLLSNDTKLMEWEGKSYSIGDAFRLLADYGMMNHLSFTSGNVIDYIPANLMSEYIDMMVYEGERGISRYDVLMAARIKNIYITNTPSFEEDVDDVDMSYTENGDIFSNPYSAKSVLSMQNNGLAGNLISALLKNNIILQRMNLFKRDNGVDLIQVGISYADDRANAAFTPDEDARWRRKSDTSIKIELYLGSNTQLGKTLYTEQLDRGRVSYELSHELGHALVMSGVGSLTRLGEHLASLSGNNTVDLRGVNSETSRIKAQAIIDAYNGTLGEEAKSLVTEDMYNFASVFIEGQQVLLDTAERIRKSIESGKNTDSDATSTISELEYAASSMDEYATMVMSSGYVQQALSKVESQVSDSVKKSIFSRTINAISKIIEIILRELSGNSISNNTSLSVSITAATNLVINNDNGVDVSDNNNVTQSNSNTEAKTESDVESNGETIDESKDDSINAIIGAQNNHQTDSSDSKIFNGNTIKEVDINSRFGGSHSDVDTDLFFAPRRVNVDTIANVLDILNSSKNIEETIIIGC